MEEMEDIEYLRGGCGTYKGLKGKNFEDTEGWLQSPRMFV